MIQIAHEGDAHYWEQWFTSQKNEMYLMFQGLSTCNNHIRIKQWKCGTGNSPWR